MAIFGSRDQSDISAGLPRRVWSPCSAPVPRDLPVIRITWRASAAAICGSTEYNGPNTVGSRARKWPRSCSRRSWARRTPRPPARCAVFTDVRCTRRPRRPVDRGAGCAPGHSFKVCGGRATTARGPPNTSWPDGRQLGVLTFQSGLGAGAKCETRKATVRQMPDSGLVLDGFGRSACGFTLLLPERAAPRQAHGRHRVLGPA